MGQGACTTIEVKGIEKMSMLGAGRGARERGGRRLEVEVNSKRRSPSHYVSNLVLETVEESCAFGEDIVLVVRCFIGAIFGHSQVPGPLRGLEIPANEFSLCDSSP